MTQLLEQPRRHEPLPRRFAGAAFAPCRERIVAAARPQAAFGFGDAGAAAGAAVRMPLTTLLTGNAVNPGEIVQLVIKPSRWFILLNSVWFAAIVAIIVLGFRLLGTERFAPSVLSVQFAAFAIAARIMWSTVQWMGRYYLLTDQRLIRVCGVFDVSIQSHALPEVTAIRIYRPGGERLFNRGSIEIAGPDGVMYWQTITRYRRIHDTLQIAVLKAKQNGCGG